MGKCMYYTEKLHLAMKGKLKINIWINIQYRNCLHLLNLYAGLGTDDSTLIRIIVSRSEIDLETIKKLYEQNYGKSLYDAVESESSGDYKKALLNLIQPFP